MDHFDTMSTSQDVVISSPVSIKIYISIDFLFC